MSAPVGAAGAATVSFCLVWSDLKSLVTSQISTFKLKAQKQKQTLQIFSKFRYSKILQTQHSKCGTMQALATCSEMRPPVDISVGGEGSSEGVGAGAARIEYSSSVARG